MELEMRKWLDMARIDIKNQGESNDLNVNVIKGKNCRVMQPQWFAKNGIGYMLELSDKYQVLELECKGAGTLMIRFRGIDRRSPQGERLPLWVDYTRLVLNDEVIFWEIKSQWHNKHYTYTRKVADGEKIRMEISWSHHRYKRDEIVELLSMCCGCIIK